MPINPVQALRRFPDFLLENWMQIENIDKAEGQNKTPKKGI